MKGEEYETEPKVFIIESIDFDEENEGLFEGHIIANILKLSNVETKYFYVRTKKELEKVIGLFYDSNFRYLHISCHGGKKRDSIWTTIDEIKFDELAKILDGNLYRKRLFLSACSVVNRDLAQKVIPRTRCYSIIGPENDIEFRDAAIMWASFYHLMFKNDEENMLRTSIMKNMQKVVDAFGEPWRYYSISRRHGIKSDLIVPKSYNEIIEEED